MPRRPLDQYETPPHYVEPLLALIAPALNGAVVYEPCVGQGHISCILAKFGPRQVLTNDIDPHCDALMHEDARETVAWGCPVNDTVKLDWTITNPPFKDELAILELALVASRNVAFLARLSFLEPTVSRAAFWAAHPPTDVIVLPRYSFRLNDQGKRQTDSVTCCWLVWRAGRAACLRFSGGRA
jgi:predicted RNA methylase